MMVVTDVVVHTDILKLLQIMEQLVNVNERGGFGRKSSIYWVVYYVQRLDLVVHQHNI